MAGSTALMDHAARDAAFAELAAETEPSCDPAEPDCEAIDTTETGREAMRRYAEGQGALPTPDIPEAIRIEIANGDHMWIINPDQLTNPPTVTDDGLCPCGCGAWLPESSGPGDGTEGPGGVIRLPLTPREPWNPSFPAENIFGIRPPQVGDRVYAYQNSGPTYRTPTNPEDAGFGARDAASIGVGFIPFVGSAQSVVELISGHDYIAGEPTSRWLAAAGIIAGVVPGGKGALKGGSKLTKIAGKGASQVGEVADAAKAATKAPNSLGHYTDFADEAADIMENAARSRGLTPNANVVSMALSRKDALKRLEGLSPQVREHLDKLAKSPTSRDAPHWRGEIKSWLEQMENVADATGKKTSAEWLDLIRKWRQQAGIE